jgi:hypothetical protein
MKKIILGCLGVLVLVTVGAGIAGYLFVYKPAKSYVASFTQLQEFPKLNAEIRNQATFTPPDSGELSADLVARYVKAQAAIEGRLGPRLKELDAKYKALEQANHGKPGFTDGLTALKDLGTLLMDAKRAQVAALNDERFSLEEYQWVREQVYAAAGIPLTGNFEQLIEKATSGDEASEDSMPEAFTGEIPEINKQLVAPHVEKLREAAALAFFGM